MKRTFGRIVTMFSNPEKRTAVIWLCASVVCFILIFIPGLVGIDGFDGGFAISFVSLFLAVSGLFVSALFFDHAGKLDRLLFGKGLIAHWVYDPQEWERFAKIDHVEDKAEKRGLFLIVAAFALFFGILFWVLDPDAGFIVFLAMLGLIGLIGVVWQLSSWSGLKHNLTGTPEAYVGKDALYLNRRLYVFHDFVTKLDKVSISEKNGCLFLVFRYSTLSRTGTTGYTTRVLVPSGPEQKEIAEQVIKQIKG
ncbi:MAG: hypothetical protein ACQCN6_11080 [Candidatus Bathyarchaeia archaeon]